MAARDYAVKFQYLMQMLERTIDLAESSREKKICVKFNILPELDQKRQQHENLQEQLTSIAMQERLDYNFEECRVIYLPLVKFLFIIYEHTFRKMYQESRVSHKLAKLGATMNESMFSENENEDEHEREESSGEVNACDEEQFEKFRSDFEQREGFHLSFKADDKYYYKTRKMDTLDREYGDLVLEIRHLENEILENLQRCFIKYSHYFADMIELTAELDVLLAFALTAQENNFTRPKFNPTAGSFILAKQVRHPLVERLLDSPGSFIPNSVASTSAGKFKVITAPNAAGKTIYLKQVALLVYMTMIGSYVAVTSDPVTGPAEIGDFDRIFTRLYSNECITYELSSFAIDLKQIADAINSATANSLVIIDEFGKGTDIALGKSIVLAFAKYWCEIERTRLPHIFLSTHYHDLFRSATSIQPLSQASDLDEIVRNERIEYLTFEFVFDEMSSLNRSSMAAADRMLIFLYKLKRGVADSSYALNIARKCGLPQSVLAKAGKVLELLTSLAQVPADGDEEQLIAIRGLMAELFASDELADELIQ
jgi:DNA mismatch repair protein MSH5